MSITKRDVVNNVNIKDAFNSLEIIINTWVHSESYMIDIGTNKHDRQDKKTPNLKRTKMKIL